MGNIIYIFLQGFPLSSLVIDIHFQLWILVVFPCSFSFVKCNFLTQGDTLPHQEKPESSLSVAPVYVTPMLSDSFWPTAVSSGDAGLQ